jgi:hypothetical protein
LKNNKDAPININNCGKILSQDDLITAKRLIGEKHYDYALAWDKIKGTKHQMFNAVSPYVKSLNEISQKRIKGDKDFKKIFKVITEYESNEKERSRVSLKVDKVKKEKEKKELAKEKEKKKSEIAKDEKGNEIPNLKNDIYLKEAIRIATDYARKISKEKTVALKFKKTLPINIKVVASNDSKATKKKLSKRTVKKGTKTKK